MSTIEAKNGRARPNLAHASAHAALCSATLPSGDQGAACQTNLDKSVKDNSSWWHNKVVRCKTVSMGSSREADVPLSSNTVSGIDTVVQVATQRKNTSNAANLHCWRSGLSSPCSMQASPPSTAVSSKAASPVLSLADVGLIEGTMSKFAAAKSGFSSPSAWCAATQNSALATNARKQLQARSVQRADAWRANEERANGGFLHQGH
eukprot:CAMPEP_0117621206 /NCGR_PEP_ID=MMETSP0784-20121206/87518_1 /TAXON_ID=39447 /ORGANISM="" /LENGTH=205 /DNA_ID=CAMNT_0005425131 /DNA_START=129 /DNA_END=746 /DNA_ORIENTATION=+